MEEEGKNPNGGFSEIFSFYCLPEAVNIIFSCFVLICSYLGIAMF